MKSKIDFSKMAQEQVNNWKSFESFGIRNREHFEGRTIYYTHNRDSRVYEQANAQAIEKALSKFGDDAEEFSANHWACGFVAGYAVKVYDANGQVTEAFKKLCELQEQMDNYPILDEDVYQELLDNEITRIMEENGWDWDNEDDLNHAEELARE